jgi:hypothetical protein
MSIERDWEAIMGKLEGFPTTPVASTPCKSISRLACIFFARWIPFLGAFVEPPVRLNDDSGREWLRYPTATYARGTPSPTLLTPIDEQEIEIAC